MLQLSIYILIGVFVLVIMVAFAPKQAQEAHPLSYIIIVLSWPIIIGWIIFETIRQNK